MSARFVRRVGGSRQLLRACLLVACSLGVAAPAAADTLSDFIGVYKQIEQVAPAGALPVKSSDFEASKGLFDCLSKPGNDSVVCINNFHDTPLGKQASDGAGIPTTFWQVVDAYVAYKENDYWGVAYHLGEAAVCAVVQVLLGGVDACSLIKELVELAKSFYDAGKAVVEFLKDVGGTAKDVATCILTLGGDCGDSGPPTPDEQYVYEYVFLPRIADGVTKRELSDGSYGAYVTALVGNAAHKPTPILSKSWPQGEDGIFGAKTFLYPHFTAKAIETARQMYEKAVDANWSKHVTQQVLPQLGTERFQYRQNQTAAVAKQAAQGYLNKQFGSPDVAVKFLCYEHFTKALPYRHVDDWILGHAQAAAKLKAVTHTKWCELEFWGQKAAFTKIFRDYAKVNLCPESGGSLKCQSLANYQKCVGLMGSVYQQQQCGLNVQSVGKDVAEEIKKYFASHGSKYVGFCTVATSTNANMPAVLRCPRPTQKYHCGKYYQENFGPQGKTPIAVKVLECALATEHSVYKAYKAKEDKLWSETVPKLVIAHPKLKIYLPPNYQNNHQDLYDPLVVGVSSELFAELDADSKKLKLDKKIVMSWEPSIDGVDVPTLATNMGSALKGQMTTIPKDSLKSKLGGVNPPDPAGKLSPNKMGGKVAIDSGKAAKSPAPQGLGQKPQAMGAQAPTGIGPGLGAAPTKPMSGGMPSGFGAPTLKPGASPLQATAKPALPKPQLAIVGVQAKIEPGCQSPQPAFTATVILRNSGGTLVAGRGTVYVRETGGANLKSAAIRLPGIGAGQSANVPIPATAPNPYSTLAGPHQVGVYLNPLPGSGAASFDKPIAPHLFIVNFPPGHCHSGATRAAPAVPARR